MKVTRDNVFDYMKGVGIIAVLIGHYFSGTMMAHVIYSFHMPLFFIINGYFLNVEKPLVKSIMHDMKRLLLPIVLTISSIVLYKIAIGEKLTNGYNFGAFGIGLMWFLLALFWVREILRLLFYCCHHLKVNVNPWILLIFSVAASSFAYYFHYLLPHWHLCLVHGLTAFQFVTLGWVLRRERLPFWVQFIFVIIWIAALLFGELDMARFKYKCYPLDVLGGVGGTLVLYYACKGLDYINRFNFKPIRWMSAVLGWCGVHSLLILCLHSFDFRALHFIDKLLYKI